MNNDNFDPNLEDDLEIDNDNLNEAEDEIADDGDLDETADVMDIDETMKDTFGNTPEPGEEWTIGDEVESDEEERRGMD